MQRIKKFIHNIFRLTGRDFIPYTYENFYSLRRIKIIENEKINLILDVGAHNGLYGHELREDGYTGYIVSFEPLNKPFLELDQRAKNDNFWCCENFALGDSICETEINVSGHLTSSSILSITEKHIHASPSSETINTETINVTTLDSIRDKYIRQNDAVYMKIDVQGYEKHVLNGASDTLKNIRVLEVELSLSTMYEGGPLMLEMLEMLKNLGFDLVAIGPVFSEPKSGHLLQADGIFVNVSAAK